jgi:hypothetical protein
MKAVERATRIRNKFGSLLLKYLPHRPVGYLRMSMGFSVANASIQQPGIELLIALEPQPRREEPLTRYPNLVLDSQTQACRPSVRRDNDCTFA